jgi:hypothetical protein
VGRTAWWSIHLLYGGGDSSTDGETHIQRARLVYGRRGDSSTEGETHLQRRDSSTDVGGDSSTDGKGESSTMGETHQRGRFVYGGGDSSTEGKIRNRGWETRNWDVRQGTEDGRQGSDTWDMRHMTLDKGREKGTGERMTGEKHVSIPIKTNFRECSANE